MSNKLYLNCSATTHSMLFICFSPPVRSIVSSARVVQQRRELFKQNPQWMALWQQQEEDIEKQRDWLFDDVILPATIQKLLLENLSTMWTNKQSQGRFSPLRIIWPINLRINIRLVGYNCSLLACLMFRCGCMSSYLANWKQGHKNARESFWFSIQQVDSLNGLFHSLIRMVILLVQFKGCNL